MRLTDKKVQPHAKMLIMQKELIIIQEATVLCTKLMESCLEEHQVVLKQVKDGADCT